MDTFKIKFEITLDGEYEIQAKSQAEAQSEARSMISDGIGFKNTDLIDYEIYEVTKNL